LEAGGEANLVCFCRGYQYLEIILGCKPTAGGDCEISSTSKLWAGRQDKQPSTPRSKTNAHKAKRLPRQASNHSVRVRAANNHGGRGSTESSQTGAHQKMTVPNCLIRALFLLQTAVLLD
jgi:hypothetical protein